MLETPIMEGEYFLQNDILKPKHLFREVWLNYHKVIYEVIRVIGGKPVFLKQHLDRLLRSCVLSGYNPPDRMILEQDTLSFIAHSNFSEKNLRVSLCFDESPSNVPMLLAYFIPSYYPSHEQHEQGVKVAALRQTRPRPNVKAHNSSLRQAADRIIAKQGVYEVLLVNRDGYITEGSRSNFFAIKGNALITPPSSDVLEGVTRSIVIDLARSRGVTCHEDTIAQDSVKSLTGAFITGTSPGVLPICAIEDVPLPSIPNITRDIMKSYNDLIFENLL